MSAAARSNSDRPHLIAVGQFPPPVTGYAYITERMVETLGETVGVETVNISPGLRHGLRKHLHKIRQAFLACWRVALRSSRSRLLYLGCEGNLGLMYTAAIVTVGYLCGYEIFLHHHSFSYIDRPSWPMRYILILGGTRIHHIFLCSTMRERLESRYGRVAHAQIISNAAFVAPPSSSISTNASCGPLRIGLLSNLTREKGLHTFVELLRRLRDSELDVVGVLAGPIADENDRLFVAKAQTELLGRLLYRGPLYGDAKDRFYHDIDVFVFPTQYANEAQPTVIFEALAAGNTIVAFDRGCIQIQIGEHGVAISTTDDFCTRAHNYLKDRICRHDIPARSLVTSSYAEAQTAALVSSKQMLVGLEHWRPKPSFGGSR